jgi:hypothetical protein
VRWGTAQGTFSGAQEKRCPKIAQQLPKTGWLLPRGSQRSQGLLVPIIQAGPAPRWKLTDVGRKAVQPCVSLGQPLPAVRPRAHVEMKEMTSFELHSLLAQEGWVWQKTPHKKKGSLDHMMEPYTPGGTKTYFSSGFDPFKKYLHCLLVADRRKLKVEHGKEAAYYRKLLSQRSRPSDAQQAQDEDALHDDGVRGERPDDIAGQRDDSHEAPFVARTRLSCRF